MGLDWQLKEKPKAGHEAEAVILMEKAVDSFTDTEKERYQEIMQSPWDTLGVPQVGLDDAATRYFLNETVPSHLDAAINAEQKAVWSRPADELVADARGTYVLALAHYELSTLTGIAASAIDFRGAVVGRSDLLSEETKARAFEDFTPPEMGEYALRVIKEALAAAKSRVVSLGAPTALLGDVESAREFCKAAKAKLAVRAEEGGFEEGGLGWTHRSGTAGHTFTPTPIEELAGELGFVLDGARWLAFWADLGHGVYAWS